MLALRCVVYTIYTYYSKHKIYDDHVKIYYNVFSMEHNFNFKLDSIAI